MGMFDEIEYNGRSYQTKDLDKCLDKYMIEDGLLKREIVKLGLAPGKTGINSFKLISRRWSDYPFHGVVEIYDESRTIFLKFNDGVFAGEVDRKY